MYFISAHRPYVDVDRFVCLFVLIMCLKWCQNGCHVYTSRMSNEQTNIEILRVSCSSLGLLIPIHDYFCTDVFIKYRHMSIIKVTFAYHLMSKITDNLD